MADPTAKRYTEQFNVMLDPTHHAMLRQLAERENVPASQLVRRWIDNGYRMSFAGEPRCITGMACLCPAAHAQFRTTPVSSEQLLAQHGGNNGTPQGQ